MLVQVNHGHVKCVDLYLQVLSYALRMVHCKDTSFSTNCAIDSCSHILISFGGFSSLGLCQGESVTTVEIPTTLPSLTAGDATDTD